MPLGLHSHGGGFTPTLMRNTKKLTLKALVCPWEGTPKGQRLWISLKRWKRVCDAIYAEVSTNNKQTNVETHISDATVGTPFRFGTWFPRAALDVPPYTTIYFQNGRIAITAPKPKHMPTKHLLPKEVMFYVRTMTAEVVFPKDFVKDRCDYPAEKYLHVAKVLPGHEAGGPAAHMVWSVDSVVGLKKHHCLASGAPPRSMQLVIVVPSTETINPGIEATQLAFSPTNFAQLHLSRRLPRIIVPLFPRTSYNEITRYVDAMQSAERLKKLRGLLGQWETFARKEVKNAGFKRWARVALQLPWPAGKKPYAPPEVQIGSPFVELLPDKGVETDRARWPRLERAAHMWGTLEEGAAEGSADKLLAKGKAALGSRSQSPRYQQSPRSQSPRPQSPGRSASPSAVSANLPSIDVLAAQQIAQASWAGRVGRIDTRPRDQSPPPSASAATAPRRTSSPGRRSEDQQPDESTAPLRRGYPWTQEKSESQRRMEELLKLHGMQPDYTVHPSPGRTTMTPRSSSEPRSRPSPETEQDFMRGTLSSTTPRTPRTPRVSGGAEMTDAVASPRAAPTVAPLRRSVSPRPGPHK